MAVAWDPALAVGHPEIDRQHQEIFRLFGALLVAMEAGEPADIDVLLEDFGDYVTRHFAAEEQVMAAIAFPGASVHAAAHARFAREFRELRTLCGSAGPTRAIQVKTRTLIEGWFRAHIGRVDQALANHLRAP